MKDIQYTLMSQYANSPVIVSLIEQINDILDPSKLIDDFYNKLWNLKTANGYGLDNWGRIIGVDRNVRMSAPNEVNFGFHTDPDSAFFTPFNVAPFSASGSGFESYALPDDLYRQLIIVKAASNIIYATAPNINKFLKMIFNERSFYLITDIMKAEYRFEFTLNSFQRLIVFTLNLLPNPCGVELTFLEVPVSGVFGFEGSGLQPFDQGTFAE